MSVEESHKISIYWNAVRPWTLSASILPVLLGNVLAYRDFSQINPVITILTLGCVLCVHIAANLFNTYYDYKYGIDLRKGSDDRTLVDHFLRPTDVTTLGLTMYSLGLLCFLLVSYLSPVRVELSALLFFVGLSGSFLYSGGIGLKYFAFGDLIVLILFGPVAVTIAYILQSGTFAIKTILFAAPLALNTESILHCNNTRDIDADRKAGMRTMAIVLGKETSYVLFCILLFAPYLMLIYPSCHISLFLMLPYVTIGEAFEIERKFREFTLEKLPQRTARLTLAFGVCYIASILLSKWFLLDCFVSKIPNFVHIWS